MAGCRLLARLLLGIVLAVACTHRAAGIITVHVVPHTHDDVGWLKTVDQYYRGQNNSIQHAYVKMILDTVVQALQMNPNRTFTYVEQAFFQRWWHEQGPSQRELVKRLVATGQLSFTNGGWCMHDEAVPFYLDMIDQTTMGHRFLMEEFGFSPKTGWQLDPFGHSATQAALLSAEVGFTGLFFGRIDYQDLQLRVESSSAEFVWRASPSLGPEVQVFAGLTGSYGGNYGPPPLLNWNIDSTDEPIQDDLELAGYNVQSRVDDFVNFARWQANHTRGSHVMFTMGSDFHYEAAMGWFENLDRIIRYVNEDGRVHALYSTPELYVEAKAQEQGVAWPLKTDDFFPYADGPHAFWTGYFTSRPALKRYIRETSAFLQVARQMSVLGSMRAAVKNQNLRKLSEAMAVAQHHDAVAGTSKQHVAFDYAARLAGGRTEALQGISATLVGLAKTSGNVEFAVCDLRNVSVCAPTQALTAPEEGNQAVDFILWNGLAQARNELVELPVSSAAASVLGENGKAIASQTVPSLPSVMNYGRPAGGSDQTLLFSAVVPPLGFKAFRLQNMAAKAARPQDESPALGLPLIIENEYLALSFCSGALCNVLDKVTGVSIQANQSWLWYEASVGNNESSQRSGAYIFRPKQPEALPISTEVTSLRVVRGPLADEVHQTFGPWVSQRIRLARGERHAEITYTVGAIPVEDGVGKEVVSRISTNITNNGECFTDSNGREMLMRKRDFRPSWTLNQTEQVAGNYFPVATALFIRDSRTQLTVLTDAAQAGTGCVSDGVVELMVHRRLLEDDDRGVSEPLNETQDINPYVGEGRGQHHGPGLVIRGRHLLAFGAPAQAAQDWRVLADRQYMPLMPFFAQAGSKVPQGSYTALLQPLPPNVQVVSLTPWDVAGRVLLRLAHQFGVGEDAVLSRPATVDLGSLFADRRVVEAEERGLAAGISRDEVLKRRVPWPVEGEVATLGERAKEDKHGAGLVVTLGPLQIRTFLVKFDAPHAVTTFV